jgi:hypothetical protein
MAPKNSAAKLKTPTWKAKGSSKAVVRPHAQLRRSQVVGGSGPGALLDLPRQAVIVGGLESWGDPWVLRYPRIDDERARARLARDLKLPNLQLFSPPVEGDTFGNRLAPGIRAYRFPEWVIAQYEVRPGIRPLVHLASLAQDGQYLDEARKKHKVVPVRFVRACKHGHLEDIDWKGFAHRGKSDCRRQLLWQERGSSGDFVDIFVGCECGVTPRSLIEATKRIKERPVLGWCRGKSPWLGSGHEEACKTDEGAQVESRLLVRNASNAYFAQVDRSISIPEPNQLLRAAVGKVIADLAAVRDQRDLEYELRKAHIAAAVGGFPIGDVMAELARRQQDDAVDARAPKVAELETFLSVKGVDGEDRPESVFFAREQAIPSEPRPALLAPLSKVLRVERLREVSVLVGFTRFEAPSSDIDGELDLEVRSGRLAREPRWLPAVENHGEGLFFGFDPAVLQAWARREGVQKRKAQLEAGYAAWATARKSKRPPPPIEYTLLHSLSHLLLTQLSLSCGYSASSIRERIYAHTSGYGILLHTGTPDAEGTLGGLVHAGRDLERLFREALELGELCSNDPVCGHHRPDDVHEERFLHGAACHGCLLIPETSCEMRNDFLDRALVVETVEGLRCGLFP